MKKNDIFTFTTPNGIEVAAVVLDKMRYSQDLRHFKYLCYAQNRLFWYYESYEKSMGSVIVDYAILPDYDELLARYNDLEVAKTETSIGM